MLIIKIELEQAEIMEEIHSFSMGHMTIEGQGLFISSKCKNRSMMIFVSISQLLDEIVSFVDSKNQNKYNFVGVDSSFQFYLIKSKKEILVTDVKRRLIHQGSQSEVIASFWEGVKDFLLRYGYLIGTTEIILNDLKNSISRFTCRFNIEDSVDFFRE